MRFPLMSLVVFASIVGLVAAPTSQAKQPNDENDIQGTWQVETYDTSGTPLPPLDLTQLTFTFGAGKLTTTYAGKASVGEYKLNPAAKAKQIDLIQDGRLSPGIYELKGDKLILCFSEGANAVRPMVMKAVGNRVGLMTFKRMKEEKKEK